MSEDKKTPKERIAEIKAKQKEEIKQRNQQKIQELKDQVKERKQEEKIQEVKKENKIKYNFTDRQVIIHGEGKKARAFFVNYNPDEEHAIVQLITDDVPAVVPTRYKMNQNSLKTLMEKAIKKVKNLLEDK